MKNYDRIVAFAPDLRRASFHGGDFDLGGVSSETSDRNIASN
jgi:hypothetical protein